MGCVAMNHNTKNASKIKTLGAALIAVCALQTTAVVAETITHRVEVPMSHSNWEAVLDVPKFDTAVGVLRGVEVRTTAVGSSRTKIENRSGLARLVVSGSDLVVQVVNAGGVVLNEVRPSIRHENRLTRFDGKTDCAGTSGATNSEKHVSASRNVAFVAGDFDLSEFQGAGKVGLKATARASGFYSGSAAASFHVETKASMAVEVVYTYEPLVIAADEALGTIGSRVWKDKDEDGIQEVNENGLKGWLVELISAGTVIASVETGNDGVYGFTDVPAGVYTVKVTAKKDYVATYDVDGLATPGEAVIEVLPGGVVETAKFGFVKNSGTDNNDGGNGGDEPDHDDADDDDDDDDKKGNGRK
jgi:SdrD B-like domain